MNRLRTLVVVAALLFATLVAFPSAAFANACNGKFAVGGYPKTHLVPSGYESVHSPGGIFPWERGGYGRGQSVGADNLIAAVDEYAQRCPGQIHVFGHSYGAAIVDTATLTLDQRDYAHRVNVHVTGSPRHPGGIEDTHQWVPGFRGPVYPPANLGSYRSECNYGRDIICDAPWPGDVLGNVNGVLGYLGTGHVYG